MPANGAFLAALFHAKFFVYAGLNGGVHRAFKAAALQCQHAFYGCAAGGGDGVNKGVWMHAAFAHQLCAAHYGTCRNAERLLLAKPVP